MKFPSKKELDEKQDFALLPAEDYLVSVAKVEEDRQKKYQSEEEEDILNIQLKVVSYKDGEEAFAEDGSSAADRLVFFTGRPESMGFQQDGTPSKTRALVAYATGQDVYDELDLENWKDLEGKEVAVEVIQKENQKGVKQNRVARFIPPKGQRPKPVAEEEEIPVIEEGEEEKPPENMPF